MHFRSILMMRACSIILNTCMFDFVLNACIFNPYLRCMHLWPILMVRAFAIRWEGGSSARVHPNRHGAVVHHASRNWRNYRGSGCSNVETRRRRWLARAVLAHVIRRSHDTGATMATFYMSVCLSVCVYVRIRVCVSVLCMWCLCACMNVSMYVCLYVITPGIFLVQYGVDKPDTRFDMRLHNLTSHIHPDTSFKILQSALGGLNALVGFKVDNASSIFTNKVQSQMQDHAKGLGFPVL